MEEWLPSLAGRRKWQHKQRDIKVGDVVLVIAVDTERGRWPLGRITKTLPGKDGNVRAVRVMVDGKEYERGLGRICPLESEDGQ